MLAEVVAVQIFPGGVVNQLGSGEAAAVLPDVLLQPVEQAGEVAAGNLALELR
ncbi:Uncharacterised protein [Raoultella terrigena]|uniref:Uncharacterized protein n=1 Tax=Raoultella terrigena TaxID=577 RepID=A0A485BJP6_RAOTE|nr:Uncharacterised protein [Raoultella terrigena]